MDQDDTLKVLKEKILSYGAQEDELDEVIGDVNNIAMQRTLKEYFIELNNPEINTLLQSSASGPELVEYFEQHKADLPPLSEDLFKSIVEKTWTEYFQFMEDSNA